MIVWLFCTCTKCDKGPYPKVMDNTNIYPFIAYEVRP